MIFIYSLSFQNLFDSIDVPSNLNEWVWSQSPRYMVPVCILGTGNGIYNILFDSANIGNVCICIRMYV